jgi:hypothetical protein
MFKTAIVAVLSVLSCICVAAQEAAASGKTITPGKEQMAPPSGGPPATLEISVASPTRLQGVLTRGNIGLRFDSHKRADSFLVTIVTLSNRPVLDARMVGDNVQLSVGDQATGSIKRRDLDRIRAESVAVDATKPDVAARQTQVAQKLPAAMQLKGDVAAVKKVVDMPEYALLPVLSEQLAKLGMIGKRYPPCFALHAMGMAAAMIRERSAPRDDSEFKISYRQKLPPSLRPQTTNSISDMLEEGDGFGFCWTRDQGPNLEHLPQCPRGSYECERKADDKDTGCYGRCGPSCTCWNSLCGDCCYNAKCAVHDTFTRTCSWNPLTWGSCFVAVNPGWLVGWGCS